MSCYKRGIKLRFSVSFRHNESNSLDAHVRGTLSFCPSCLDYLMGIATHTPFTRDTPKITKTPPNNRAEVKDS